MKLTIAILVIAAVIVLLLLVRRQHPAPPPQDGARSTSNISQNKPLLKQFGDLTAADFSQNPVWVNVHVIDYGKDWYNETDEETFRPWDGGLPADPSETMFLVKAKLILADGTIFSGFLTPQQESGQPDLGTIQPHLFTHSGDLVPFWFGMFQPARKDIDDLYEKLGKTSKDVFPIQFQAENGMAKGVVRGTIPGFCWRDTQRELIIEK